MSDRQKEGTPAPGYYTVVLCPGMILRQYLRSNVRAAQYFKDLGGYFPLAVAPIDSRGSQQRKVSLKVHLVLYTFWNLLVQQRNFFLVNSDAAFRASCWAGFLGIPVSNAFLDLRDLWIHVDLAFRAAIALIACNLEFGAELWQSSEGLVLQQLQMPLYGDCNDITA